VRGAFEDEAGAYAEGSWLRMPEGGSHAPRSSEGCTLYVKTGGLAGLASEAGGDAE
jgi:anti-sigma factor ChrR (cupin superfamily)